MWASELVWEGCTTLGACLLGKVALAGVPGDENWEVISRDTLGDAGEQRSKAELEGANLDRLDVMVSHEGFGQVVMTTLGSWMVWRLLA